MEGGISSFHGPEHFSWDCLRSNIIPFHTSLKAQATCFSQTQIFHFGGAGFKHPTTSELSGIFRQVAPFPPLVSVSSEKNVL